MTNRVGTKGQLVIEKEIRDQLGIEPGAKAVQSIVNGHLEIHFLPPEHNRSLAGLLAPLIKNGASIRDMDWNEVRERAWDEELEEDRLLNEKANADADGLS